MKKVYQNKTFFNTIETTLKANKKVAFTVKGNSMKPFFKDGKTEVYLKIKEDYKPKDICLFQKNKMYFLHRLIKIKSNRYFFRGDNQYKFEIINKEAIIAYVYQYKNNDHIISTNNLNYKIKINCFLFFKQIKLMLRFFYLGVKNATGISKKH
ncbi:MAG: S24/S26 family peptidase [Bacillota bacterium]